MNYWIFTVTEQKDGKTRVERKETFQLRMNDRFWGIAEKTPNRKNLLKGDKIVFYVSNPDKNFAGTAILSSSCIELSDSQRKKYAHGRELYTQDHGVLLEEIEIWSKPILVQDVLQKLKFIENKEYWGAYFQGGVRQLTEEDYRTIIDAREIGFGEQMATAKDIESPSEFALEIHLEDFMFKNWGSINWGSRLELYETDEQNGRQFPAGIWSIDFLAIDRDTKDLVVIELKRGKTSEATVGQILKYISWVKENIAEKKQNVSGLIITREADDALRYSIKNLAFVEVKEYKVDFELRPFKK